MEALIEAYLTSCGKVFVSSQYHVPFEKEDSSGGSNPDFVALDFSGAHREVVVVEVTTSSNLASLEGKIRDRQLRWFRPIMTTLMRERIVDSSWSIRFLGFIRDENVARMRSRFSSDSDVWFFPIERAILGYEYWEKRMSAGLPRPFPTEPA